jgi:hypothetical protein
MVTHFNEGDLVCGVDFTLAKQVVRCVDSYQWCSAGAVASELGQSTATMDDLLRNLHDEGYLSPPHCGKLPDGHAGKWLTDEADEGATLLLWHITTAGKQLAKAQIGTITRDHADRLLREVLERCDTVNHNPRASHWIDSVLLYGSLCDPLATEVGDVDIAVAARRREGDLTDARPRMGMERYLRAGNERADVVVTDESWSEGSVIPDGTSAQLVFERQGD